MRLSAFLLVGWVVALWAHRFAAPAATAITVVFGVLGMVLASILFVATIEDVRARDVLRFVATVVAGPIAGWAIGSSALLGLTTGDALARLGIRVLASTVAPAIACIVMVVRSRPPRTASVLALVLCGFAALSGASAAADVARGKVQGDVVISGVNYEQRTWTAYFDGVSVDIDPNRHDVAVGDRGRATYLAASHLLLDFAPESRAPIARGVARHVRGAGFGRASALVAAAAEVVLIAGLVAARARRVALLALMIPLMCFPDFLVLTAFGHSVEASVIDKAASSARSPRTRLWSYVYAVRARTDGGRPVGAMTDAESYHSMALGDRVRCVVGPGNTSSLETPDIGGGSVALFAVSSLVAIAFARRRATSPVSSGA